MSLINNNWIHLLVHSENLSCTYLSQAESQELADENKLFFFMIFMLKIDYFQKLEIFQKTGRLLPKHGVSLTKLKKGGLTALPN